MKNHSLLLSILIIFSFTSCNKDNSSPGGKLIKLVAINNQVYNFIYNSDGQLIKRSGIGPYSFGTTDSFAYQNNKVMCYELFGGTSAPSPNGYFTLGPRGLATSYTDSRGEITATFDYDDHGIMSKTMTYLRGYVSDSIVFNHVNDSLITFGEDSVRLTDQPALIEQNIVFGWDVHQNYTFGPVENDPLSFAGLTFLGKQAEYLVSEHSSNSGFRRVTYYNYELDNSGNVTKLITSYNMMPDQKYYYWIQYY